MRHKTICCIAFRSTDRPPKIGMQKSQSVRGHWPGGKRYCPMGWPDQAELFSDSRGTIRAVICCQCEFLPFPRASVAKRVSRFQIPAPKVPARCVCCPIYTSKKASNLSVGTGPTPQDRSIRRNPAHTWPDAQNGPFRSGSTAMINQFARTRPDLNSSSRAGAR